MTRCRAAFESLLSGTDVSRFAVAPPVDQLADFTCEESLSLLR